MTCRWQRRYIDHRRSSMQFPFRVLACMFEPSAPGLVGEVYLSQARRP